MIHEYLLQYGENLAYALLFLGSLVEGESFVLTAGYLAHEGFLSFVTIVLIAFCGSVGADQILFFVGRKYGNTLLDQRPKWRSRADKVFRLLHTYNTTFIMGFRFVYGIRTLSPLLIGASGISIKRFAVLNVISGAIWALISCGAGYAIGYFFSDAIDEAFHTLMHYQKLFFIGLLVCALSFSVWFFYRKKDNDEDIVFEPSTPETDLKSPCHTTKIIPLVPCLQRKEAHQNRKANTTMNTHIMILLATFFFSSCGYTSDQSILDITGRSIQASLTPDDILESTLDEFFGPQTPSQRVATPETHFVVPTQAALPLPPHINCFVNHGDVHWLQKTLTEANAIQNFALQQMMSPGTKPDAAFFALSPMHQQSAMAGVSIMQQFFPQEDPCPQNSLDAHELD